MSRMDYLNQVYDIMPLEAQADSDGDAVSSSLNVESYRNASLFVQTTESSGTPDSFTLDVKMQWSPDISGDTWIDVASGGASQITSATATEFVAAQNIAHARRIRVLYDLSITGGASPTVTFRAQLGLSKL